MRQQNQTDRTPSCVRKRATIGVKTIATKIATSTRQEVAHFNQFLDTHREVAEQLRKDPSLVDRQEFVHNHPALQSYLREHPELSAQLNQDPNAFMHQEDRYDRGQDDHPSATSARKLARFNQFLDTHHEVAEQLRGILPWWTIRSTCATILSCRPICRIIRNLAL